jgi:hypothetical protein
MPAHSGRKRSNPSCNQCSNGPVALDALGDCLALVLTFNSWVHLSVRFHPGQRGICCPSKRYLQVARQHVIGRRYQFHKILEKRGRRERSPPSPGQGPPSLETERLMTADSSKRNPLKMEDLTMFATIQNNLIGRSGNLNNIQKSLFALTVLTCAITGNVARPDCRGRCPRHAEAPHRR